MLIYFMMGLLISTIWTITGLVRMIYMVTNNMLKINIGIILGLLIGNIIGTIIDIFAWPLVLLLTGCLLIMKTSK